MAKNYILFVFLACATYVQGFSPCNPLAPGSPKPGEIYKRTEINADKCISGRISWDWPTGVLLVTFQGTGPAFMVCIEHGQVFFISEMYDETSGSPKAIPIPDTGKRSCVESTLNSTRVVIKFVAPSSQMYWTDISYAILPQ